MPELLPWHAMQPHEALASLASSRSGLDDAMVADRRKTYGANVLDATPSVSAWVLFLRQFESPFVFILLVAIVASAYFREWFDAGLIVVIILANGVLGFAQEYRANKALQALRSFLKHHARVLREGQIKTILAADVVPGDILLLAAGDRIAADCRLLSADFFTVDESVLTGESQPVEKRIQPVSERAEIFDRTSMAYSGTAVSGGRAEALVTAIGLATEFGRIAELATEPGEESTPLQRKLQALARSLAKATVALALVLFVAGLWRGVSTTEMLAVAAAVAVAIVPEGLIVAMTVILTVGMRRLLARNVLVRTLSAAEALGGIDVLCVDKTGTITTGEMTVAEVRAGVRCIETPDDERSRRLFLALGVLSSGAVVEGNVAGSLTDRAIASFIATRRVAHDHLLPVSSIPFHPSNRFSARIVADGHVRRAFVMGAADALMSRFDADDDQLAGLRKVHDEMTARGLRVLAVAEGDVNSAGDVGPHHLRDLSFLGLVGISDPLRPSVPAAVTAARDAGIRTIMITGDHPETAKAIALQAGIVNHGRASVITGVELSQMDDVALARAVTEASVFARILPEQKLRIVNALKAHGHEVAMTGDGINDAPALQAADVGIAVGHATDVAKEIADIVLLESDFARIIEAVTEGRTIVDNLRKEIGFLLGFSLSEAVIIAGAIVLNLPWPLLPLHVLFLNLTEGIPSMALAFEPTEAEVMRRPTERHRRLLDAPLRRTIASAIVISSVSLLGGLFWLHALEADPAVVRAWMFGAIGFGGIAVVFVLRVLRRSVWVSAPWKNVWLLGAVAIGVLLTLAVMVVPSLQDAFGLEPLPGKAWVGLGLVVLVQLVVVDVIKRSSFRRSVRASVLSSS